MSIVSDLTLLTRAYNLYNILFIKKWGIRGGYGKFFSIPIPTPYLLRVLILKPVPALFLNGAGKTRRKWGWAGRVPAGWIQIAIPIIDQLNVSQYITSTKNYFQKFSNELLCLDGMWLHVVFFSENALIN